MRQVRRVHMVGVGGSGMSGIAEVLLNLGYQVSGSDIKKSQMTERLKSLGVYITYSHIPENIVDCDVVVASSAISEKNIEIKLARQRRVPVVPRAEMLAELMRFKTGIAIAGSHGKTTITSLTAAIFAEANYDPTYVVGGLVNNLQANAKLGEGEYFIAESDESDASFLQLMPVIVAISNIDNDHLSTYRNDFNELKKAFITFANRVPFYGLVVACIDDPAVASIMSSITRPLTTYGFSELADIRAMDVSFENARSKFKVKVTGSSELIELNLNLPGNHNILNALAAIALSIEANISMVDIKTALATFSGVSRRFNVLSQLDIAGKTVQLIDDYGHHPSEIKQVINAARASWPNKRVSMIFQPHRYSRTQSLFDDFVKVLSELDTLMILDVYSAGEQPITGADSRSLCAAIRQRGKLEPIYIEDKGELCGILETISQEGELLFTQGAGDINKITKYLEETYTITEQVT